ncbi:hypothetical protein CN325_21340 [Bacillus thuringiensis]|nr:hypothetical protein CN325_21340 [Bacillus thuringiensis]PGP29860.1 hypothetical protein CN987_12280 [Bacillus thuringiensis]
MKIRLFFHLFKECMKKTVQLKNGPSDLVVWGFDGVIKIVVFVIKTHVKGEREYKCVFRFFRKNKKKTL